MDTDPAGVLVLGMHRCGTSAATRMLNLLGLALCDSADLITGQDWNPRGHWESRSLVAANDLLLSQMGCTWWSPPPAGSGYVEAADRITVNDADARRAFHAVYRETPWVWKDPRTSLLLPFWRRALGAPVTAVVIVRNPIDAARSLERRNGFPPDFSVALWARHYQLILEHVAPMPVLLTRYDDLVADPTTWATRAHSFLAEAGVRLGPLDEALLSGVIDPGLRHAHAGPAGMAQFPHVRALFESIDARIDQGAASVSSVPDAEDPWVAHQLATRGPRVLPEWHAPPR